MRIFHWEIIGAFIAFLSVGLPSSSNALNVAVPMVVPHSNAQFGLVVLPPDVQRTVEKALEDLIPKHVQNNDFLAKKLGFTSASEVREIQNGQPFPVLSVGLGPLRNLMLTPGREIPEIITLLRSPVNFIGSIPLRFIYPVFPRNQVTVTGAVKSGIMVNYSRNLNIWRVTTLGLSDFVKELMTKKSSDEDFVLWVPSLNRFYLGKFKKGTPFIEFTILYQDLKFSHVPGQVVPAVDLFNLLQEKARSIGDGTEAG